MTSQTHRSTLGGLQAGEKYLIQVNTVTSKGDSPYSGSMVVTTNEMTQTLTQKMKNDLGINTLSTQMVRINVIQNLGPGIRILAQYTNDGFIWLFFANLQSGYMKLQKLQWC